MLGGGARGNVVSTPNLHHSAAPRRNVLPPNRLPFIWSKSRKGRFLIIRKTRRDRMMAKLLELKEEMRRRMHWPISEQGEWLKQVVGGFFNYHAVPTNSRALAAFRHHVRILWGRTLRRRSQKDRTTWDRIAQLAEEWLPKPRILPPWPNVRFAVKHPR